MIKVFSFILFVVFIPLACAQEKPKDQKELSPSEVVKQWIDAAAKKDMKTVAKLASKTTTKQSLKLIQEQGFLNYQGETKIIHEENGGDRAVVVYRLENRDAVFTPEIRYDMITLVREAKQWKVSQQRGGVLKEGKQPLDHDASSAPTRGDHDTLPQPGPPILLRHRPQAAKT